MTLVQTFYQKYRNHACTSDVHDTPEFKSIATKFKNALKKMLGETQSQLLSFNKGYFCLSGFIRRKDGQLFYFATRNFRTSNTLDNISFRTVEHLKDYCSGKNQYCHFPDLALNIEQH